MKITFLGGTETVTGSKYLVETSDTKLLVDCGLYQGYKWLRERNREPLPLELAHLDAVILTHAHLDHSGYVPVLYKNGFRGDVISHHATRALCHVLLEDSGHIQEEDARYYRKHRIGKHEKPEPLYDRQTAIESLSLFSGAAFDQPATVGNVTVTLLPAGHILGAASVLLEAEGQRVIFSGDVGRTDDVLMLPPRPLPQADHLILESTYGNRRHAAGDVREDLAHIVKETVANGGVLMVPSFAVGRAQALMHLLSSLMKEGEIPTLPVYLDSPMAIDVSDIYCEFQELHRLSVEQCREMYAAVTFTGSVDESKALAQLRYPHIIIAGSGMATGGRILHHFKRLIGDHRNTVMFTGYQAGGSRGAKMLEGMDTIKIHGGYHDVRAQLRMLEGLSGHADQLEMGEWLEAGEIVRNVNIHLVHGSPDALEGQREHLSNLGYHHVNVAEYRRIVEL